MKRWKITIRFWPHPKTRKLYELELVELKTKAISEKACRVLAVKEAEKCWPHFDVEYKPL